MSGHPLTETLRRGCAVSWSDDPAVELELRRLVDEAVSAWPTLRVDAVAFIRYLAERWDPGDAPVAALREIRAADLALAHACARGDRVALSLFESEHLARADRYLAKAAPRGTDVDEIKQRLRERLLLGRPGEPPRIAGYEGRGPLAGWVRTVAARTAVDLKRTGGPKAQSDPKDLDQLAAPDDLELAHLKGLYGQELTRAFHAAIAALPARELSILKLHFIDGTDAASIGRVYRVNARTIQRWILGARQQILEHTRALLGEKFGLNSSQLQSVLRLARSQIDASINSLLDSRR